MNITESINTATRVVDTAYNVATFDWNKKSVIRLAITTIAIVGVVALVTVIDLKRKDDDYQN